MEEVVLKLKEQVIQLERELDKLKMSKTIREKIVKMSDEVIDTNPYRWNRISLK